MRGGSTGYIIDSKVDASWGREYEETVKDVEFYLPEGPVMLLTEGAV